MIPWIVMAMIGHVLNLSNVFISIFINPNISIVNILSCVISSALWYYFYLVVCSFKAEVEKEWKEAREGPLEVGQATSAPATGFLDLPTLKREWKTRQESNINYQPFN